MNGEIEAPHSMSGVGSFAMALYVGLLLAEHMRGNAVYLARVETSADELSLSPIRETNPVAGRHAIPERIRADTLDC